MAQRIEPWTQEDAGKYGARPRRVRAATLLPLRVKASGCLEVLVCQIEVLDPVRSTPDIPYFHAFPGELRFIGGQRLESDTSPIQTLMHQLHALGFPSGTSLRAFLFNKVEFAHPKRSFVYEVFNYVAFADDNPHLLDPDLAHINLELQRLREQCARLMRSGKWWTLSPARRARYSCCKVHQVSWMRLEDVLSLYGAGEFGAGVAYVNEWQREEMHRFGLRRRVAVQGMLDTLLALYRHGAKDQIIEASLLSRIGSERTQLSPLPEGGMWPEQPSLSGETANKPERLSLRSHDDAHEGSSAPKPVPGVAFQGSTEPKTARVLSYNLNVLPAGVSAFVSQHGSHARERLRAFVRMITAPIRGDDATVSRHSQDARSASPPHTSYDILALQEVFASPFLPWTCHQAWLVQTLQKYGGYKYVVRASVNSVWDAVSGAHWKWTDSGLLIMSRLPIIESETLTFAEEGMALDSGAAKGALFARIQLDNSACVDVVNVHLQATHTSVPSQPGASWCSCLNRRNRSRNAARATREQQATEVYEQIRDRQMQELVRFIRRKTHHSPFPLMLTGDFNVDAIAPDAGEESGLFFYAGPRGTMESDEYRRLVHNLAPIRGAGGGLGVQDLLKIRYGRHVSTRPPRLRFPRDVQYALRHKYPQRLDYVFWFPGGLGQVAPEVNETAVVEFRLANEQTESPSPESPMADEPVRIGREKEEANDLEHVEPGSEELQQLRRLRPHDYRQRSSRRIAYLSDHFGLEVVLRSEPQLVWGPRDSGGSGSPTGGRSPLERVKVVGEDPTVDTDEGSAADETTQGEEGGTTGSQPASRSASRSASPYIGHLDDRPCPPPAAGTGAASPVVDRQDNSPEWSTEDDPLAASATAMRIPPQWRTSAPIFEESPLLVRSSHPAPLTRSRTVGTMHNRPETAAENVSDAMGVHRSGAWDQPPVKAMDRAGPRPRSSSLPYMSTTTTGFSASLWPEATSSERSTGEEKEVGAGLSVVHVSQSPSRSTSRHVGARSPNADEYEEESIGMNLNADDNEHVSGHDVDDDDDDVDEAGSMEPFSFLPLRGNRSVSATLRHSHIQPRSTPGGTPRFSVQETRDTTSPDTASSSALPIPRPMSLPSFRALLGPSRSISALSSPPRNEFESSASLRRVSSSASVARGDSNDPESGPRMTPLDGDLALPLRSLLPAMIQRPHGRSHVRRATQLLTPLDRWQGTFQRAAAAATEEEHARQRLGNSVGDLSQRHRASWSPRRWMESHAQLGANADDDAPDGAQRLRTFSADTPSNFRWMGELPRRKSDPHSLRSEEKRTEASLVAVVWDAAAELSSSSDSAATSLQPAESDDQEVHSERWFVRWLVRTSHAVSFALTCLPVWAVLLLFLGIAAAAAVALVLLGGYEADVELYVSNLFQSRLFDWSEVLRPAQEERVLDTFDSLRRINNLSSEHRVETPQGPFLTFLWSITPPVVYLWVPYASNVLRAVLPDIQTKSLVLGPIVAYILGWVAWAWVQPERAWACLWRSIFRISRVQLPVFLPPAWSAREGLVRDEHGSRRLVRPLSTKESWQVLRRLPSHRVPCEEHHSMKSPSLHPRHIQTITGVASSSALDSSSSDDESFDGQDQAIADRDDVRASGSSPLVIAEDGALVEVPGGPSLFLQETQRTDTSAEVPSVPLSLPRSLSFIPDLSSAAGFYSNPWTSSSAGTPHGSGTSAAAMPIPETAYELFLQGATIYGFRDCLGWVPRESESGLVGASLEYRWMSYTEVLANATYFGSGLRRWAEVSHGARVGILASNRVEWVLTELACHCFSLVSVPLHAPSSEHLDSLLLAADIEVCVCDREWTPAVLDAWSRGLCSNLRLVVQTDSLEYEEQILGHAQGVPLYPFGFVIAAGRAYPLQHRPPDPANLATITFAWDAQMNARAVLHTHASLCAMSLRLRAHPLGSVLSQFDVHCSYLPLAYEGERVLIALLLRCGASIGFVSGSQLSSLARFINALRPTFFLLTPRFMDTLHTHFARVQRSWSLPYRLLFRAAYLAKRRLAERFDYLRQDFWGDMLVFRALSRMIGTASLRFLLVMGAHPVTARIRPAIQRVVELTLCCPIVQAVTMPEAGFVLISRALDRIEHPSRAAARTRHSRLNCRPLLQSIKDTNWKSVAWEDDATQESGEESDDESRDERRVGKDGDAVGTRRKEWDSWKDGGFVGNLVPGLRARLIRRTVQTAPADTDPPSKPPQRSSLGSPKAAVPILGWSLRTPPRSRHADQPGNRVDSDGASHSGFIGELVLVPRRREMVLEADQMFVAEALGQSVPLDLWDEESRPPGVLRIRTASDGSFLDSHSPLTAAPAVATAATAEEPRSARVAPDSPPRRHRRRSAGTYFPDLPPLLEHSWGRRAESVLSTGMVAVVPERAVQNAGHKNSLLKADAELWALGDDSSLLPLGDRAGPHWTVCERLEALYVHSSDLMRQVFVDWIPGYGLGVVAAVNHEAMLYWAADHMDQFGPVALELRSLCRNARVEAHILTALRRQARRAGLSAEETARGVHLTPRRLDCRDGLATPTGLLCRTPLRQLYREKLRLGIERASAE